MTTRAGASAWLGLLPNSALQPSCSLEGFNLNPSNNGDYYARARIGVLGNDQADCGTPDSFIGVGASVGTCGVYPTTGNRGCFGALPADGNVPALAAVFVRPDDFSGLDARPSCSAHLAAGRRIDGVYAIDPDGDGAAFPAYCDMTTAGGGWTLLMRVTADSSSHVLDNGAVGSGPCRPDGAVCKVATTTIDELLAHEGTQVFAVRPDGAYQPFFVRADSDDARWPPNLEASNRAALLADARHAWIVTSYRSLAGAELSRDGDVGTWAGAGHYYPTLHAPEQVFFRGNQTGLRSMSSWDATTYSDNLSGALWVRTSGFEHLGVAASCLAHRELGRARSGVYLVGGDAQAPRRVYCDMTTNGGGWTLLASFSGADGESPMLTTQPRADGDPFSFGHLNLAVGDKVALSAGASEALIVRPSGHWLHVDAPLFDTTMLDGAEDGTIPVTATSDDGTSRPATVGWSYSGITHGGDFGISVRLPTAFDRHASALYRMLNAGCADMLLYSYSVVAGDSDVGYDVNTALGSWTPTYTCEPREGGRLRFYVGIR